jgi:CubicO group peptidase (beta-lactamase class C family)
VTKLFTAVAVMQLVEEGRLGLQDKLNKYLPDFPPGEKIRIHHLLTHTSGLPSFNAREKPFIGFQEVTGLIKALSPNFEPGEGFEYSNSGYALLAGIIEKVTGEAYEDYVQRRIVASAGMMHSGMVPNDPASTIGGLAVGYSLSGSGGLQPSQPDGPKGKGEGSLFSSAEDMLCFSRALLGGRLVSQKALDQMFLPFKEAHGMGCIVEDYRGWKVVSHPGGMQGVRASYKAFLKPGSQVVVIDLFNTDFMLSHLVDGQVEKIALGEPGEPIFSLNPSRIGSFRALAGTYEISADETFQITVEGDQIHYQEPGQQKRRALPFSETALFVKDINSRFHFTVSKTSGDITYRGFYGTPAGALMVEGRRIQKEDR